MSSASVRTWLKPFLALALWTLIFAGFAAYRHSLYLRRLGGAEAAAAPPERTRNPDEPSPRHPQLTVRQDLLLGWSGGLAHLNSSSYILHPPRKSPGVYRIGIFGDSLIEGAETARDRDFPTLLQKRFRAAGNRRVEIVNFGVSGFGFNQSFLMWEFFAERYGLDLSIFFIGAHYFARDDTFTAYDDQFDDVHARYILRGGEAELLPPLGSTPREASLIYHGLAPAWRYLRYDARLPVQARMLLSFPTASRLNPFYYAPFGDIAKEMTSIERLLLARAAAKTPVVLLFDPSFRPYQKAAMWRPDADFTEFDIWTRGGTLLTAPRSHLSAMGNRLMAERLFAYLTGRASVTLPFVQLVPAKTDVESAPRPLSELSNGVLSLDGKPIGRLMVHKRGAPQAHVYEPLDLKKCRVPAFFFAEGGDPAFVQLPRLTNPKEDVSLWFTLDGEEQQVSLGRVSAPAGIVASLIREEGKTWKGTSPRTGKPWEVQVTAQGLIDGISIRSEGKIGNAGLRLAGSEILRGAPGADGRLVLKPTNGEIAKIRMEEGQDFDPFHAKNKGLLTVGNGTPFIGYRLASTALAPFERPLRTPVPDR